MSEYNKGFTFYENYYQALEIFPIKEQQEICWAIVKYAITGEKVDASKYPIAFGIMQSIIPSIDNSVKNMNNHSSNGQKGGRKSLIDPVEGVKDLIEQTLTKQQIAEKYKVKLNSVDQFYHRHKEEVDKGRREKENQQKMTNDNDMTNDNIKNDNDMTNDNMTNDNDSMTNDNDTNSCQKKMYQEKVVNIAIPQ